MAQNDAVTVSEDVPFSSSISLLANDSDVDGDSLSVVAGTFVTAASGVKVTVPSAFSTAVPPVPLVTLAMLRLSPSTSLSLPSRSAAGDEGPRHHRQAVAVDVAVVGQQADAGTERHVLADGDRIVLGHRATTATWTATA
ncbi:Ig-like domain-containing protein [Pseudomonas stutzeri]|nr:Ig-like domain-containing protein [Stutzerimonas stutzeri]